MQNLFNITHTLSGAHTTSLRSLFLVMILSVLAGCGGGGGESIAPEPTAAGFTSSVTEGEYDLLVQFTDTSTGAIESWLWDFGDGNSSTEQNPSHTYTAEGIYTVSLTVTGPEGEDTLTCADCITVLSPAPEAAFDLDPSSGTYDLTVNFTDLSTGPIDSWLWDFGDGNTSDLQNPSHLYTEEGNYTVSLLVEGPGGSDTSICDACVTVSSPPPVANFVADPTSGIRDLDVQFSDSSTGPITSRLWDFGDGSTSDLQNPLHTYTVAGSYTVSLTVSGPGGSDTMTCSDCITVLEPAPIAEFSASATSGIPGTAVEFTDLSSGPIDQWIWDFGDGQGSAEQNPTHTFAEAGLYTVTLTVIGPGGEDSSVCIDCIDIQHPAPVADFSLDPASGTYDLVVQFSDTSSGPIDSYSWDLGDGSTSSEQNPLHTYTEAGSYTVTLTVEGPGGIDTATCIDCVTVIHPAPTADFSASVTEGTYDLQVTFTNSTQGPTTDFLWDFGDGQTSTEANPTHTYTEAGVYTVSLMATGPGGSDTATCSDCITVLHPAPIAAFQAGTTQGDYPLTVSFVDLSTGPISIWAWDFGDGTSSNDQHPTHTYLDAGSYDVTLTIIGPGGTSFESCQACIIVEHPAPEASFSASTTSGTYDLPVQFTNTSTGPIDSQLWDFGDGATSSAPSPSHTYTAAGTYTVTLTVTGPGGSDTATCQACITVDHPAPTASFTTSTTSGTYDLLVQFESTSTGPIDQLSWDFGDGTSGFGAAPSHTYTAAGTYTVTLTATGPGGSDTAVCQACITVDHPAPTASFTTSTSSGTYDLLVQFESTSTGPIDQLSWDFGDGTSGSGAAPSHLYTAAGTYTVTLTATGPGGSDMAICQGCITVEHPEPVASFEASTTSGIYDLAVNFTNTSSGPITDYAWDFGDGSTSTEENPSHTYTAQGIYTVTLMVTGPGGSDTAICTACIDVASPAPSADFSVSVASGDYDLVVQFTNLSSGPITDYMWDFGDGTISTESDPQHTYTAAGSYTVTLTVTGPGGSDTHKCPACINVTHPEPVANFSVSDDATVIGSPLTFTDLSTGPISDYMWDFGDGTSSTMQNPTHAYDSAGTYTVTLTVMGPGGTSTHECSDCISVQELPPVANFAVEPVGGIYELTLGFTDLSTGVITSWLWEFGDGATSTEQHPTHTYAMSGGYDITLTVTGPGGSDTLSCLGCGELPSPPPIANMTIDVTSGEAPLTVNFTDISEGEGEFWLWNFGDGNVSVVQNPTHTYMTAGTYTVTLTVSGPGGEDTSECPACINVIQPPDFRLEGSDASVALGDTVDVRIRLDHNSTGVGVQGWSYGLCHDSLSLEGLSAAPGAGLSTINNGGLPDFHVTQIHEDGITAGVVISFLSNSDLPVTNDLEVNVLTYTSLQEGLSELHFCNSLGTPPIEAVVVAGTTSHPPVTVPIQVTVTPAP